MWSFSVVSEAHAVSVFRIDVAFICETEPTPPTSTGCKDPKAESTPTMNYRVVSVLRVNVTLPRSTSNKSKDVYHFPPNGVEGKATITHAISLDMAGTVAGAMAYITSGGIGYKRISIGYTYKPNYGISHMVEIYGR
jgi:hypothetical protein